MRCNNPSSIEGFLQIKQEKQIIEQDRDISQQVFAETIKLIQNQHLPVEEAQKQAISIIAKKQIQTKQQGGELNECNS
jgi:hypothetical protein